MWRGVDCQELWRQRGRGLVGAEGRGKCFVVYVVGNRVLVRMISLRIISGMDGPGAGQRFEEQHTGFSFPVEGGERC